MRDCHFQAGASVMLTDLEPQLPFLNFTKYTEFLPCSQQPGGALLS